MYLQDIMQNYKSEDLTFECKLKLEKDKPINWLKTINGFANAKGGIIYVGVENGTNKLVGFTSEQIDKEKIFLYSQINQHFKISPQISTEIIDYTINEKVRYILKVIVLESVSKPNIMNYDGMPMIFIKRDGFTSPATEEEIHQMSLHYSSPKFDMQLTSIDFNPQDYKKLFSFYSEHNSGKTIKIKELESIGAIVNNKVTKGLLLFSDNYQDDNLQVTCTYYKGLTRGDNEIISSNSVSLNLIDSYKFIYEFIHGRMNHGFIKKSNTRIDFDAFPERALFEAIINALAHRDYLINGSQISVDLFKNRLVISSPGNLYLHGNLDPTYNMSSFISQRRNEMISKIFVYCHVMESKGTGFEKIEAEYKDYNIKHKPFIFSKNNQFSIVLPDITYEDGVAIENESITIKTTFESKTKYDISILSYCYEANHNIKEITSFLNVSNSSYFRNTILNNLVIQNLLLEKDINGTKHYTTNTELVGVL